MKKNIIVVMGGPSAEYEVSLKTGWEMFRNLDRSKYSVRAVVIDKEKNFHYTAYDPTVLPAMGFSEPFVAPLFKGPFNAAATSEIWKECDLVMLGLHGEFGEDGIFQGFLETLGIRHTGSKVTASAIGMNKISSKEIFEQNGVITPPYSVYRKGDSIEGIASKRGFPCFVKCPQSGSSRLMGRATNTAELAGFLAEFTEHTQRILIESAIIGDEYSCPVLEFPDGSVKALPPILIKPASVFFDYTAKYSDNACEEIVPAPCSKELTARIQEIALMAHQSIGCAGISRTDMIVTGDVIYTLEINTLPGFTAQSLLPKSFKSLGGTFQQLLDILIETELGRKKQ